MDLELYKCQVGKLYTLKHNTYIDFDQAYIHANTPIICVDKIYVDADNIMYQILANGKIHYSYNENLILSEV